MKIEESNSQINSLEKESDLLIEKDSELGRWKRLLYTKGKHELEPIIQEALRLIGCSVQPQPDKGSDGLVTSEYGWALLEVVGSNSTIKGEKYGELVKNIGNFIQQKGKHVKGFKIGNPLAAYAVVKYYCKILV